MSRPSRVLAGAGGVPGAGAEVRGMGSVEEPFVDPELFRGTVYHAANWIEVGAGARGPGLGPSISTPACNMECRR